MFLLSLRRKVFRSQSENVITARTKGSDAQMGSGKVEQLKGRQPFLTRSCNLSEGRLSSPANLAPVIARNDSVVCLLKTENTFISQTAKESRAFLQNSWKYFANSL